MTVGAPATPGRPRDPEVDRRVLEAALEQFAAEGWKAFSIESVARRARVGKASIYLRWDRKEDMLAEAFRAHALTYGLPEVGHVRDALYDITMQLILSSDGYIGAAHLRLRTDQDLPDELTEIMSSITRDAIASSRRLVKMGIETGELPRGVSPSLFMDCLAGAVTNRALASQSYRGTRPLKSHEEFASELVNFLLRR